MNELTFVALDCETTGLDPSRDTVIEFGATKFTLSADLADFAQLVNPGRALPSIVKKITGITDAELAAEPHFDEVRASIEEFVGDAVLVGHNLAFDLDMLRGAGLDLRPGHVLLDTFDLAGLVLPRIPSRNLAAMAGQLGLKLFDAHRALADSVATKEVFRALVKKGAKLDPAAWQQIGQLRSGNRWLPVVADLAAAWAAANPPKPKPEKVKTERKYPRADAGLVRELGAFTSQLAGAELPIGLLETDASANDLAAAARELPEPALLAVGTPQQAQAIAECMGGTTLLWPSAYIDESRLAELCQQELTDAEAGLAAKLLLHPRACLTELNFSRVESLLFDRVAADSPEHAPRLAAELAKAESANLVVTTLASIPEVAGLLPRHSLIAAPAWQLANRLAAPGSLMLDLTTLEQLAPEAAGEIALLWGRLGLLHAEAAGLYGEARLPAIAGLKNFGPAAEIMQQLLTEQSDRLPRRVANLLASFLDPESPLERLIRTTPAGELTLIASQPETPELVFGSLPQDRPVILADAALASAGSFEFSRRRAGLPGDVLTRALPPQLPQPELLQLPNMPDPTEPSYQAALENRLAEILPQLPGITAVVFTNQTQLGATWEAVHGRLTFPVLADRYTGSRGNIEFQLKNSSQAAYFTTLDKNFLPPRTQNLILIRLPFIVKPDADWATETLPAAVLSWKRLWAALPTVPERPAGQLFLAADPRLTGKAYGRDFARSVEVELVAGWPR